MSQLDTIREHFRTLHLRTAVQVVEELLASATTDNWSAQQFLSELLEQELEGRHQRRIERLKDAAHLPIEKTLATFDQERLPLRLRRLLPQLCTGEFVDRADNLLVFGFDIVEWETDVNKPGADKTNEKFKKLYGYNLAGESVDAYAAMYVLVDALERAKSLDPKAIRDALAQTKLSSGPAMIVGYDAIEFDASGQNKQAALVMVQVNDIGKGMERITVWPKVSRRANYKPVFPTP